MNDSMKMRKVITILENIGENNNKKRENSFLSNFKKWIFYFIIICLKQFILWEFFHYLIYF